MTESSFVQKVGKKKIACRWTQGIRTTCRAFISLQGNRRCTCVKTKWSRWRRGKEWQPMSDNRFPSSQITRCIFVSIYSCWLSTQDNTIWTFVGPALVVLMVYWVIGPIISHTSLPLSSEWYTLPAKLYRILYYVMLKFFSMYPNMSEANIHTSCNLCGPLLRRQDHLLRNIASFVIIILVGLWPLEPESDKSGDREMLRLFSNETIKNSPHFVNQTALPSKPRYFRNGKVYNVSFHGEYFQPSRERNTDK